MSAEPGDPADEIARGGAATDAPIWVEILSRHRDLIGRYRCDGGQARIGRAYDNDVVVDDPAVAPHHLRVFRDESGKLVAEDLGSTNGLFDGDSSRRLAQITVDGDRPLRIGRSYLRIRDASHPVAAERQLPARARALPTMLALALVLFGLELISLWLGDTAEPKASRYVIPVLALALFILVWAAGWSIISRIFSGQARFDRHLLVTLGGLLAFSLFGEFTDYGAFSLSWRWLSDYSYVIYWLLFAALCFFHLREIGPRRLKLKALTLGALAGVAIATQSLAQAETRSWFGQQAYVRNLKPPLLRLAKPQTQDAFFADAVAMKAKLDLARKDPPASSSLLPGMDDD